MESLRVCLILFYADALHALRLKVLTEEHPISLKLRSSELVDEWILGVQIDISNFKSYFLRTYHGVSCS